MIGPIAAGAKRAGEARVVYVMTDGAALPGAFSRLVFELRDSGLDRRMDHHRTVLRRRARGRHGVDGDARRQGGPRSRRHRRRGWPGEPRHRHHLGRQRARERQRPQRGGRARRPSDPEPADQLRRRTCAASRGLTSFAHDLARRLPRSHGRAGAGARGRCPARADLGRAARREARGAPSTRGGRRSARARRARRPTHRAPFDGTRRRRRPGVLPGRGRGRCPRRAGRRRGTVAGVPEATPSPGSRRPGPRASDRSAPRHPRGTGSRCPPR